MLWSFIEKRRRIGAYGGKRVMGMEVPGEKKKSGGGRTTSGMTCWSENNFVRGGRARPR